MTLVLGRTRYKGARQRGFTLIELMIVVAVVAILVAIAYPSYQEQMRKSRRAQAQADLIEYAQAAERYHTVNNTYADWDVPNESSPRTGAEHYSISVDDLTSTTFTLTATPTSAAQADDRCGVLTTDHAGRKFHASGADEQCNFGATGP